MEVKVVGLKVLKNNKFKEVMITKEDIMIKMSQLVIISLEM